MGKKRGGRPRKTDAARHPNGSVVRPDIERPEMVRSVGVEARMRVYSITRADAEKQESGYALGRYLQSGAISAKQALAGEEYERVCRSYDRAMGARGVRSASDYDGGGGYDGDEGTSPEYVAWCNRAQRDFEASLSALMASHRFAVVTLDFVLKDHWLEPGTVMFEPLPVGLDALVKLYRVEEWSKQGEAA